MDIDGSNQLNLTSNSGNDKWPEISQDGFRIIYLSDRDGNDEVYTMNIDGSNQTNITYNPAVDWWGMFQPQTTVSIGYGKTMPEMYVLHQNYPNPFNPVTSFRYDLPENTLVNITIYDMMGRLVKTLINGSQAAGYRTIQWNATNNIGQPVSAGVYLYTIQAGEFRQTKKMVLLK
jgi:hypothetical protein